MAKAGFELMISPALASSGAGITGLNHKNRSASFPLNPTLIDLPGKQFPKYKMNTDYKMNSLFPHIIITEWPLVKHDY